MRWSNSRCVNGRNSVASSLKNLEEGGLPLLALHRIKTELRASKRHFTSDLSVDELLFTHHVGFEPVSQVMGNCIYQVGSQYLPYNQSGEQPTITHAYWHARTLAMSRMQQEARLFGADGVVGVRILSSGYSMQDNLVEFVAIGTAVRAPEPNAPHIPFLSGLSGQDLWALHVDGFRPVGIAYGNCVWYQMESLTNRVAHSNSKGFGTFSGRCNYELTDYTAALSNSRHSAMRRMEADVRKLRGDGVVGVKIVNDVQPSIASRVVEDPQTGLIARFQAMGTAIVQYQHSVVHPVDYSLQLSDH